MSQYKLTYFDFSGSRGEECRTALFVAGVPFEDDRIKSAVWPTLKANTPFGSMPVLEHEGRKLAQSNVILTYIGRKYGLLPSDPWEAARHESVLGAVEDLRHMIAPLRQIKDPVESERQRKEFADGALQTWAAHLEKQIEGPFIGGQSLGVADIKVFIMLKAIVSGTYDHIRTDAFSGYPKILGLLKAVEAHPRVAEWRATAH